MICHVMTDIMPSPMTLTLDIGYHGGVAMTTMQEL